MRSLLDPSSIARAVLSPFLALLPLAPLGEPVQPEPVPRACPRDAVQLVLRLGALELAAVGAWLHPGAAVLAALVSTRPHGVVAAPAPLIGRELVQEAATREAADAAAGTVTSKDGTRIAFERVGQGPALILVSGALSEGSTGRGLAALLAPRFTVIHYDRRGRGKSGDSPPYAVEREVEDIAALIEEAGGSAHLFGASSGAVLALEAATRLPGRVAKLALYEPPFIVDDSRPRVPADFVARVTELVATGRRSDAVELFMSAGVGLPSEAVAQMKSLPMWKGLEALAHTLAYDGALMGDTQAGKPLPAERWAACATPTLVLFGGASEPWLQAGTEALAALLPHAVQRVLEGQDHSAAIMAPQVLAPVLQEFLAAE